MIFPSRALKTALTTILLSLTTGCATHGEEVISEAAEEVVLEAPQVAEQNQRPAPATPPVREIDITRFDDAIAEFSTADASDMPPTCATLFVGSSSIRFWSTLERDFPTRKVINRGFGGSTIAEVNHYFDQIVAPYKPSQIVFYAGENDINFGQTPEKVFSDFEVFMQMKEDRLGTTPVWFVSSKPSKLRFAQMDRQAILNEKIEALSNDRYDLAYIDIVEPMLKEDGTPKDIFVSDDLHMTEDGYAIWTPLVTAALNEGQPMSAPHC